MSTHDDPNEVNPQKTLDAIDQENSSDPVLETAREDENAQNFESSA